MSPHLTDADLVLYRQGDAPDGEAVARTWRRAPRAAASSTRSSRVLALVEADSAPEQDASYGVRVWNAIETRLDAPAPARRVAWPVSWRGWLRWCAPPAALAGAVAALADGRRAAVVGRAGDAARAAPAPGGSGSGRRARRGRRGPSRAHEPDADRVEQRPRMREDVGDVHAWAEDLASANRLYRQSAALSGDEQIGRLLDDLERVLLEVAHAPDGATPGADAIESLRGRLDTRGVAFKVRLASAELRAREGAGAGALSDELPASSSATVQMSVLVAALRFGSWESGVGSWGL